LHNLSNRGGCLSGPRIMTTPERQWFRQWKQSQDCTMYNRWAWLLLDHAPLDAYRASRRTCFAQRLRLRSASLSLQCGSHTCWNCRCNFDGRSASLSLQCGSRACGNRRCNIDGRRRRRRPLHLRRAGWTTIRW
jgi:hypothetical protein